MGQVTSATLPGTAANLGSGVDWTTPDGIKQVGGDEAYRSSSGISKELTGTNFGFSIPTGSEIKGILLEINRRHTVDVNTVDNTVRLKKTSGAVGDNKASVTEWPQTNAVASYGSSTDLWGTTWTPEEINSSDFGAFLKNNVPSPSGDSYVDSMKITIYYDISSPSASQSPSSSPSLSDSASPSASTSGSSSESPSPSSSISYSQAIGSGMHSKGSYETLPSTNDHLEIEYGDDDDQAILADDGIRASIVGAGETLAHQFTFQNNTNRNGVKIKLNLRSTLATYTSPAILQIWNNQTNVWDTLMINNSTGANVDFDMINIIDSDYEKYYDESYKVIIRVYQALG